MSRYTEQPVRFAGPVGNLEGKFAQPNQPTKNYAAVICHPHPVYGGTMENKVAYTLSRAMLDCGIAALRFNYRGVGNSAGNYNHGSGETDDVVAAMQWLQQQQPSTQLILAGFSFGGAMALQAALQAATQATTQAPTLAATISQPAALITIAPPLMDYADELVSIPCPWLYVHSRDDDVVDFAPTAIWMRQQQPAPQIIECKSAGHFFHGQLNLLRQLVVNFTQEAIVG